MRKNSNGNFRDEQRKRFDCFNYRGDYIPGSMSKVDLRAKPSIIKQEDKTYICNRIDEELKKGKSLKEIISVLAKDEESQQRLAEYYFAERERNNPMDFETIINRIYNEREMEREIKAMEKTKDMEEGR